MAEPNSKEPIINLEEISDEPVETSTVSFSDVPFTFTHGVIALAICVSTIVDGFNDNFVVYTHDTLNYTCGEVTWENKTGQIQTLQPKPMTCPEYKIDNTVHELECINPVFRDKTSMVPGQSSYISDFKLVCGKLGLIPDFMLSIMFAGVMCATPFNYLADAFGRKTMMAIACLLQGVAVLAIALSQNEALYGAGLFFSGFMGGLKYKAAAVLIIESVTSPYRAHAGTALLIAFSSGYVLLAFLAQLIPQWRSMLYVISALSVVSAAIIQFFVLESTGWLARTKKYEKMEYNTSKLVKDDADRERFNKEFRDGKIGDDEEDESEQATGVAGFLHQVMSLFKNKILLPRLFVGFFFWFCTSILFRVFALNQRITKRVE